MSDNRPRSPDRRLTFVAPLSIAAVVGAILIIAWLMRADRRPAPETEPPLAPAAAPATPAAPAPPAVEMAPKPFGRADLIERAEKISAEFAAGSNRAGEGEAAMIGRAFVLRIPLGCDGSQGRPAGAQGWTEYDAETGALRLVARPGDWTLLPLVQGLPGAAKIEAVEGFWIPRPWLRDEACPRRVDDPAPAVPTPPSAQTLGLAQVFREGGTRLARRNGRPYQVVLKAGPRSASDGYRLVLEGRIVGFDDGRALRCWSESPEHHPVCVYGVALDRVAFEGVPDDAPLAEWRE